MRIGKSLFAAILLVAVVAYAQAAPTIIARVSSTDITVDDTVILDIEVTGITNINGPQNMTIPDFQVQGAGRTQSMQWINGETSALVKFSYMLTPIRAGTFGIPSIQLPIGDEILQTQPITINVRPSRLSAPSAPPAGRSQASGDPSDVQVPTEGLRPVFMTASVDKSRVYVGEQIVLTVQFLRRTNISLTSQPRYTQPDTTGFVVEPLKQQEYTTHINGIPYVITELRTALFPTTDGEFAIGNASINVRVQTPGDPFDPNTFFQSLFNQGQTVRLNTRAIPIQVRALPKNKPDNFSGAVGRFKISARIDTKEPEVGKPLNLIVRIDGRGNVKALREPPWPDLKSFRRYETLTNTVVDTEGTAFSGHKEFKVLMIPQVSGTVAIPPLSFSYFNPETHRFVTDQTSAIPLQVKPGVLSSHPPEASAYVGGELSTEGVRVVERDIRFIKTGSIRPARRPLIENPYYWAANTVPLLFAVGAGLAAFRTRRRSERMDYYRSKEAILQARRHLRKAKKLIADPDGSQFYGALFASLSEFLGGKLGLSASGLTLSDVDNRLKELGIDETMRKTIGALWDESDMARFGVASFSLQEKKSSVKQVEATLKHLNKLL